MKPSNNPVFAGIDFGTSSIKICLFNLSGTLLKESSAKIFVNFFQKSFAVHSIKTIKEYLFCFIIRFLQKIPFDYRANDFFSHQNPSYCC